MLNYPEYIKKYNPGITCTDPTKSIDGKMNMFIGTERQIVNNTEVLWKCHIMFPVDKTNEYINEMIFQPVIDLLHSPKYHPVHYKVRCCNANDAREQITSTEKGEFITIYSNLHRDRISNIDVRNVYNGYQNDTERRLKKDITWDTLLNELHGILPQEFHKVYFGSADLSVFEDQNLIGFRCGLAGETIETQGALTHFFERQSEEEVVNLITKHLENGLFHKIWDHDFMFLYNLKATQEKNNSTKINFNGKKYDAKLNEHTTPVLLQVPSLRFISDVSKYTISESPYNYEEEGSAPKPPTDAYDEKTLRKRRRINEYVNKLQTLLNKDIIDQDQFFILTGLIEDHVLNSTFPSQLENNELVERIFPQIDIEYYGGNYKSKEYKNKKKKSKKIKKKSKKNKSKKNRKFNRKSKKSKSKSFKKR